MADRAHLSIGEVLSLVQEDFPDVTISKIRFLESQGLLDPERTPSGYRKFYDCDIERLQWILTQQRDNFLPLKVIRDRLDEWDATGTAPTLERSEEDTRHAAASFAATSAVEVMARPDEPAPVSEAAMDAGSRQVADGRPAPERSSHSASGTPAEFHVGPSSTSLTAEELAKKVGVPASVISELESYSLIESKRIGAESYFDPAAVPVAEACRAFLGHGVEVRHLRMYKIAAEREAGMFEQLVMPLLKQRNPEARARAVATVKELADAGGALHAALLRNALGDTLP